MLEELCTIKQACFSEKAGRTTVYKRIKEGHYRAVKIGGSTRLVVASLKAYRLIVEPQYAPVVDAENRATHLLVTGGHP